MGRTLRSAIVAAAAVTVMGTAGTPALAEASAAPDWNSSYSVTGSLSPQTPQYGQNERVTFTVRVNGVPVTSGTLKFFKSIPGGGAVALGSAKPNSHGQASVTLVGGGLTLGAQEASASYFDADGTFDMIGNVAFTVVKDQPNIAISPKVLSVSHLRQARIRVGLSTLGATPTGWVRIYDGRTVVGFARLSDGRATLV